VASSGLAGFLKFFSRQTPTPTPGQNPRGEPTRRKTSQGGQGRPKKTRKTQPETGWLKSQRRGAGEQDWSQHANGRLGGKTRTQRTRGIFNGGVPAPEILGLQVHQGKGWIPLYGRGSRDRRGRRSNLCGLVQAQPPGLGRGKRGIQPFPKGTAGGCRGRFMAYRGARGGRAARGGIFFPFLGEGILGPCADRCAYPRVSSRAGAARSGRFKLLNGSTGGVESAKGG